MHSVMWQWLDRVGLEYAVLDESADVKRLEGTALLVHDGAHCRLDYSIGCDADWRTRNARVSGWIGDRRIDVVIEVSADQQWSLNGSEVPDVAGCVDVDLNFSPSTNLLPIRRIAPPLNERVDVRAAWLRFPEMTLEPLEQSYTHVAENRFRYESRGGEFVAELTVAANGMVIDYGDLWRSARQY